MQDNIFAPPDHPHTLLWFSQASYMKKKNFRLYWGSSKWMFKKISQNFAKFPFKFCLISLYYGMCAFILFLFLLTFLFWCSCFLSKYLLLEKCKMSVVRSGYVGQKQTTILWLIAGLERTIFTCWAELVHDALTDWALSRSMYSIMTIMVIMIYYLPICNQSMCWLMLSGLLVIIPDAT